jgi:hypothetical protein
MKNEDGSISYCLIGDGQSCLFANYKEDVLGKTDLWNNCGDCNYKKIIPKKNVEEFIAFVNFSGGEGNGVSKSLLDLINSSSDQ